MLESGDQEGARTFKGVEGEHGQEVSLECVDERYSCV